MSGGGDDYEEVESDREAFADAFNRDIDPLKKLASTFEHLEQTKDIDPLKTFKKSNLSSSEYSLRTRETYETTLHQWRDFMASQNRHHACPNDRHVHRFIDHLKSERGNADSTIKNKLRTMSLVLKSWQLDDAFPHSVGFNPFLTALKKRDFEEKEKREFHPIPHPELSEIVQGIGNLRDLVIVLLQLKLGLRATEVCNIKLKDMNIQQSELQSYYPELETSPSVEDKPNSITIPSNRIENKSKNDRVMPLDDELRMVLGKYLTIRSDADSPYLILSKTGHSQITRDAVNYTWKKHFPNKYLEDTDRYDGVTSHFGRHLFTSYWRVDQGINRELIRYMRGDVGAGEAMDEYIHVNFEKVREVYLEKVPKYLLN